MFFCKRRDLHSSHHVEKEVKYKKGEKHWGFRTGSQALEAYLGSAIDLLCGLRQPSV